jgi:hypothetical protein
MFTVKWTRRNTIHDEIEVSVKFAQDLKEAMYYMLDTRDQHMPI